MNNTKSKREIDELGVGRKDADGDPIRYLRFDWHEVTPRSTSMTCRAIPWLHASSTGSVLPLVFLRILVRAQVSETCFVST
jgi:hypothetical protein